MVFDIALKKHKLTDWKLLIVFSTLEILKR